MAEKKIGFTSHNVTTLLDKYSQLKTQRRNWEHMWEQCAAVVLPNAQGFLGDTSSNVTQMSNAGRTPGARNDRRVFDSSPIIACERFASIMDSMLTPRQTMWHGLRTTDDNLNSQPDVRQWFYNANRTLYNSRYNPTANFASQNYARWLSMGAFGTGCLFIDYKVNVGLRYRHVDLHNIYITVNHQGIVDTVYRRIMLDRVQAAEQFPTAHLSSTETFGDAQFSSSQQHKKYEFLHVVKPNLNYDPSKLTPENYQFSSYYIQVDNKELISGQAAGFRVFPYAINRYVTFNDEVYGRGPAQTALADILMLNEMNRTDIRAAHKIVDPPLLVHDDGVLSGGGVNLKPGGLNYGGLSREGRALIAPLITGSNLNLSDTKIQQRRDAINDVFLVTLFNIMVETPRMTATEALIRAQEKGMLLTPTMGRQQSEALGPMIERELDLLMFNGIIPPPPQELLTQDVESTSHLSYDITYESPMSRMQRAEELVGVQRTMEVLAPFAQMDPQILDIFDGDELARLTAEVSGVPMPVLRSSEDVDNLRQARAQQEQQQRMMESVQPLAAGMKDIAKAQQLGRT